MLTKQERATIAKRALDLDFTEEDSLYEVLIGEKMPDDTSYVEDNKTVKNRLIELCYTYNMIELPLDKNGEVIHISDVVYDNSGMEWEVDSIRFFGNGVTVYIHSDDDSSMRRPGELTHDKSLTIKSLAGDIKRIANKERIDRKIYKELIRIALKLEDLGDSDD